MISLLLVDIFDTVATLISVATVSGLHDKDGKIINFKQAMLSDAIGTCIGATFGATTTTSYIESSTGISCGGRTGLTAVVTGILFLVAIIFSPIFLLIPAAATTPALIFVGFLMLGAITNLDLRNLEIGLPVFITMLIIPFSYSITIGLAWGFITYVIIKVTLKKFRDITIITWILTAVFLFKIIVN
jgi:AGZA family xanthine/uracil permease-like MFS transporter